MPTAQGSAEKLWTVKEMAAEMLVKSTQVEYVIRHHEVACLRWIGHTKVYDDAAFEKVAHELACISRGRRLENGRWRRVEP